MNLQVVALLAVALLVLAAAFQVRLAVAALMLLTAVWVVLASVSVVGRGRSPRRC